AAGGGGGSEGWRGRHEQPAVRQARIRPGSGRGIMLNSGQGTLRWGVLCAWCNQAPAGSPCAWPETSHVLYNQQPVQTGIIMTTTAGTLYVVATPIGNLQDMSARALDVLRSAALIAAEDTRHSARLLQHFGITTPTTACHDHNERDKSQRLVERLLAGDDLAL